MTLADNLWDNMKARTSSIVASIDRQLVKLRVYRPHSRRLVKLQSLLAAMAIATGVLFLLTGVVMMWRDDGGSNLGVDILWWIVWILYSLARLSLLAIVIATIYEWFLSRRKTPAGS